VSTHELTVFLKYLLPLFLHTVVIATDLIVVAGHCLYCPNEIILAEKLATIQFAEDFLAVLDNPMVMSGAFLVVIENSLVLPPEGMALTAMVVAPLLTIVNGLEIPAFRFRVPVPQAELSFLHKNGIHEPAQPLLR